MASRDDQGKWVAGTGSPNPKGRKPKGRTRSDGWQNALTGVGVTGRDKRNGGAFCADIIDWATALEYWRGDDLAARIIETPPNEMLRQGFELHISADDTKGPDGKPSVKPGGKPGEPAEDPIAKATGKPTFGKDRRDSADGKDVQELISSAWEDLELIPALHEALCYERAYGGAAILLGANDGSSDLSKPLNEDKVQSFDWITVLEPREIQPINWYDNPRAPKFGKPEIFQLTASSPGLASTKPTPVTYTKVHESRLIIFRGIRVSRLNQSGTLGQWGDSVLTRCINVLRDFNLTWGSASILLQDFAQAVYKIKGLAELFINDEDDQIKDRIKAVDYMRSSVRAILIDSEEEFERKQTPVSGLPELLDRFSTRLAAAADQPLTLLMGQSPGGLNATGESDVRFFYDRMRAQQDRKVRPAVERICKLLFKANGIQEPESWSIHFHPLWQPTEKEQAEARFIQSQTDEKYIVNSVLSPDEVAHARFGGEEFSFQTPVDFDAREALEVAAPPPVKNEHQVAEETAAANEKAQQMEILKAKATGGGDKPFGK